MSLGVHYGDGDGYDDDDDDDKMKHFVEII